MRRDAAKPGRAWAVTTLVLGALFASGAAAQQAPAGVDSAVRTMLLRAGDDVDADVAEAVDLELARALRNIAGVDEVTVSPMAFEELSAAAGCARTDRACLGSVATHLEAEAVVLRSLEGGEAGLRLTLVYFDAHLSEEPPRVTRALEPGVSLVTAVASSVRMLFGIPEPVTAEDRGHALGAGAGAESPMMPFAEDAAGVQTGSLIVLGTGALILLGGAVTGTVALLAQSDYEDAVVRTRADAEAAVASLERAEQMATAANVLFMVGGAVALVGAVMVALDLGAARPQAERARLEALLLPGGVGVSFWGPWGTP